MKGSPPRPFVLHRNEPALIIDLREAFELEATIGVTSRSELLIVRSGSLLLAVPADACVGVRDLDLRAQVPVPTKLLRDGDVPVGHIVELDEKMLVVLDPNRLVDGAAREALVLVHHKALRFEERETKLGEVWKALTTEPTASHLRVYARLCGRNGRSKMAAAARTVLKCLTEGDATASNGTEENGGALPAIVQTAQAGRTGVLHVRTPIGDEEGRLTFVAGKVVDAACAAEQGRAAVKRVLALPATTTQFVDGDVACGERISESTVALALWALDSLASERRPRRSR
jgi:hypothetical protein